MEEPREEIKTENEQRKWEADAALQRETGAKCVGTVPDRKDDGERRDDGREERRENRQLRDGGQRRDDDEPRRNDG
jgi:IS30 family transposase